MTKRKNKKTVRRQRGGVIVNCTPGRASTGFMYPLYIASTATAVQNLRVKLRAFFSDKCWFLRYLFTLINYPLMKIQGHSYIFHILKNVWMPARRWIIVWCLLWKRYRKNHFLSYGPVEASPPYVFYVSPSARNMYPWYDHRLPGVPGTIPYILSCYVCTYDRYITLRNWLYILKITDHYDITRAQGVRPSLWRACQVSTSQFKSLKTRIRYIFFIHIG
jgi:hypothetical protein